MRLAPTSQPVRADLDLAHEFFHAQLVELFDRELATMTRSRRDDSIAALDAVTSWETWERLRNVQGIPERRARRVVTELVRQTVTNTGAPL